jgi:hypothetical protein
MIKKLLRILGGEATGIVNDIEKTLHIYRDEGYINNNEVNALRHYYGIKELSKEYGDTLGWLMGAMHEGFSLGLLYPPKSSQYLDTSADLDNNKVALDHFNKNIGMEIDSIKTINDLREPLDFLNIPNLENYVEAY